MGSVVLPQVVQMLVYERSMSFFTTSYIPILTVIQY